ncbi:DctP family TRAP transporter solute-binding subunit [Aquibacillus sp. 3ASR75-11]|uniref:DctP family TRAP transporter solute-binding subunit n=1 Tax=Terrihalobacillus insolitus TaxID=2950438 RepID=A0A9X3WTT2_9BACI|nr:DctP family TRAP transporter solute-binding subunit [Terrihalobacillus insolitus]MDC3423284.1 DctP family TRAP transporter solute-binding subunit [Terrihalobacillus insolitus]
MKKVMWVLLVSMFLGLLLYTTFNLLSNDKDIVYDDEQEGLNDQIIIKFSYVVAENTPKALTAQKFAELAQEKTNGRVKVEVFPNGILYSDEEEIEAIKNGNVQMIAPASSKVTSIFPELNLLDLPFAFPTYESIDEALTGEIGKSLLKATNTDRLIGFSLWNNGFKQVTSNRGSLTQPEDFQGQYFRVMPGDVIEKQFDLLNVQTSQIPFNLTYLNLENGTITGQENTLSNIYSKKFYEVQDHMTISNHGLLSYVVLMNKDFWNGLPQDIQKSLNEAMEEATDWNLQNALTMNKNALEKIKKKSDIHIHELTREEKESWMKELNPVYEQFEPVIGKELLSKLQSLRKANGMRVSDD